MPISNLKVAKRSLWLLDMSWGTSRRGRGRVGWRGIKELKVSKPWHFWMFTLERKAQLGCTCAQVQNSIWWRHFQHRRCWCTWHFQHRAKTKQMPPVLCFLLQKRILLLWWRMLLFLASWLLGVDQGQIDDQAWWLIWPTKIINPTKSWSSQSSPVDQSRWPMQQSWSSWPTRSWWRRWWSSPTACETWSNWS